MKAVKSLVVLMALACCVDGRVRLGKIFKRQVAHRDYKALQSPQTGFIDQSVVRNSFPMAQPQQAYRPEQAYEVNVPLIAPENVQAQYQQSQQQVTQQQAAQQQVAQQQVAQQQAAQYQQAQQVAQQQVAQQQVAQQQLAPASYQPQPPQAVQPSYPAPAIPPILYQPLPSNQVQQGQQASYQELSILDALQSPDYSQAVMQAIQAKPAYAQAIGVRDERNKILMRLPSNATLIRPNIIDGFSCAGRTYGYYADVQNDCQIFHVCFPLKSVFNNDPTVPDVTYEFSFICNEFTRFSQDSMTCAWTYEAIPCRESEYLYSMNDHFFKITTPAPTLPPNVAPYPNQGPILGSVQLPAGFAGYPST